MIPLDEAVAAVIGLCRPVPAGPVPLADALGLVAAEAVTATTPVPPFPNAAMDGYAVRAEDTAGAPVALAVAGSLAAGDRPGPAVPAGGAVRIMTGAVLPDGADAVCMVEHTRPGAPGTVVVERPVEAGAHVRHRGEDVAPGERLVAAGERLDPARLALVAGQGRGEVVAHRRPVVGVLSTGAELAGSGAALAPGAVYDTNRPLLLGLARRAGAAVVDLGMVGDDAEAIGAAVLAAASGCDLVCTSGGVSVGDFDLVKTVLGRLCGPGWRSVQVAVKPAKPLAFGSLGEAGTPVVGLPGNPVSAGVGFELFVRPALARLAGEPCPRPAPVTAVAADPLRRRPDGKVHLVRVAAAVAPDGRLVVRALAGQGSHQLRTLAASTALAVLEDGEGVEAGAPVPVLVTDPGAVLGGPGSW